MITSNCLKAICFARKGIDWFITKSHPVQFWKLIILAGNFFKCLFGIRVVLIRGLRVTLFCCNSDKRVETTFLCYKSRCCFEISPVFLFGKQLVGVWWGGRVFEIYFFCSGWVVCHFQITFTPRCLYVKLTRCIMFHLDSLLPSGSIQHNILIRND